MKILLLLLFTLPVYSQIIQGIVTGTLGGSNTVVSQPVDSASGGGCTGSSPSWACTGATTITLTDATSGATICYRVDGVTITVTVAGTCPAGSTTYSAPFTSPGSTFTLTSVGTKAAMTTSSQLSSVYTITSSGVTFQQAVGFTNSGGTQTFTPQANPSLLCVASNDANPLTSNVTAVSDSHNGSWTSIVSNDAAFSSLIAFCVKNTTTSAITITYTSAGGTGVVVVEMVGANASFPASLPSTANGQLLSGTAADANTSGSVTGGAGDAILVFGGNYYGVTSWAAGATNPSGITLAAQQNIPGAGNDNVVGFYALLSGSYSALAGVNPGTGITNYTNVIAFAIPH